MNFLNPFALIGLAAASIPLVLHLLNLRRLKTIDFGTLRFLQELQQKQVRKLKIQQILLLIIRTLLVVFAVLALSRPTIQSSLPLLGSTSRSSIVILVDNSGSMEAADGSGSRLQQAKKAAREIVASLKDGDEVVVLPMTGLDPEERVDFTRTFDHAREQIEALRLQSGTANLGSSLRIIKPLLERALHLHKEVYVISDGQKSLTWRDEADTGHVISEDLTVFFVRIGEGQRGIEQNLSVDSINVLTKLLQPDKPVEIEAFIRNGSDRDVQGALASLAFDGRRIAQISFDAEAGATKRVTLAASPQRYGLIGASVELESDAIDRDNVRYAGLLIPKPSRIALVGSMAEVSLLRTVLTLPGMSRFAPSVSVYSSLGQASSAFSSTDVVMITQGEYTAADAALLRQYVDLGGGAVLFAGQSMPTLASQVGVRVQGERTAGNNVPFGITSIDKSHPLYSGVFVTTQDRSAPREAANILRIQPALGGFDVVQTTAGPLISEFVSGQGRLLYIAVAPNLEWGSYPLTGLFAATTIRSSMYLVSSRDQGVYASLGEAVTVPVHARLSASDRFVVRDVTGAVLELPPARLPSTTFLNLAPQFQPGVVKVSTPDSLPVTTVSVNASTAESLLSFFDAGEWKRSSATIIKNQDRVVEISSGSSIGASVEKARTGAELWSLFTVLALLMAAAEMLVARFMARESNAAEAL